LGLPPTRRVREGEVAVGSKTRLTRARKRIEREQRQAERERATSALSKRLEKARRSEPPPGTGQQVIERRKAEHDVMVRRG
jgi:predicted GTPase